MTKRGIIFKTGLAVMLTGFFIFLTSSPSKSFAYDGPPPESDSVILERHKHDVRVEYTLEEFSDHSFNSHLSDEELDSIMNLDRISIQTTKMYYSPDSAFKIAVIELEGCGAYCNPQWKSWLHYNDGSGLAIGNLDFTRIRRIEKMPDGKYLVIDQMSGRSGVRVDICSRATLISIKDHQFKSYTFPKVPSQETKYDSAFAVWQSAFTDTEMFIQYEYSTSRLNYQYTPRDWDDYSDSLTIYTGYFHYEKGAFIFKEEKSARIPDGSD